MAMKRGRKKRISQDKVNKMVLDILEDIGGLATVYTGDIGAKLMNLSTYIEFGKELKEI